LEELMRRVIGLGGIFFKARDPEKLYAWYEKHLGITRNDPTSAMFFNKGDESGLIVWSIFTAETTYFEPSAAPFMINYRVENLDALLEALAKEGVSIEPKREEYDYGKFAWINDPEGNKIELWEPKGAS
jgi:predicted enzyme related to lactoylglutathione lyase